jgi:outer membrane protein TolC
MSSVMNILGPRARGGALAAWALVWLSGAVSPALAQAPAMRKVEFSDAVREALEKSPTMGLAATTVERADALLAQARAFNYPALSGNAGLVTLDAARGFTGGITQPRSQLALGADVRYTLGGWVPVSHAVDQKDVAIATSFQARQAVAVTAAQAYLAVIANRRQVEVAQRAVRAAQDHLDYADKRLQGGAGSLLNQLRAAQSVTSDQLRLQQAELALLRAQEALGVALAADGPLEAGSEPAFDVPATIDEASWMTERPDLRQQAAVTLAARHVVRDNWFDWAPWPTVAFDPQIVAPAGIFAPAQTWRFSITATQPIFDGGQRKAVLRQRKSAVDQSLFVTTSLQVQARAEVRVAQESVRSLERALVTARTTVEQATEVLRITTAAFEVGATTNIEVIDAQRSLLDAETSAAEAEDAVRRARLDVLVAIGRFPQ